MHLEKGGKTCQTVTNRVECGFSPIGPSHGYFDYSSSVALQAPEEFNVEGKA
jgi:hypothetical protein